MQSREDSRRTLAALVLPPIVSSIFEGRATHDALRYRCQSPVQSFAAPVPIPGGEVTPLWECGVVVTAYQKSMPEARFIRFSLESPEEITVVGSAFASVIADLLATLWEDEVPDSDLRDLARMFGFDGVDRLLEDLAATPQGLGFEQHRRWLAGILAPYERTA